MPDVVFGRFEWDADKAARVWRERRVDFRDACRALFDPVLNTWPSVDDDPEDRWLTTGNVDGRFYTVVHCGRGNRIRIITAWHTTKAEHDSYHTKPR
jgi:uncharacterized DUF497 family protein